MRALSFHCEQCLSQWQIPTLASMCRPRSAMMGLQAVIREAVVWIARWLLRVRIGRSVNLLARWDGRKRTMGMIMTIAMMVMSAAATIGA